MFGEVLDDEGVAFVPAVVPDGLAEQTRADADTGSHPAYRTRMAHAVLTTHLQRFFPTLPARVEVGARTRWRRSWAGARQALARAGLLPDRRARAGSRKHVAVWVDGERLQDRERLTDVVKPDGEVHVLQALSGG